MGRWSRSGLISASDASARALFPLRGALALVFAIFCVVLFKHLSYPLFWNDEAETAMYATRILEYGYPKVHGPKNTVYELGAHLSVGVKEAHDSYIGNTWAQYYFAAIGAALAEQVEDLYARTRLLRLPFALAGALGLTVFHLGIAAAFGSDRRRRLGYLVFAFGLSILSISLLLHLREARSYSLALLLLALSLRVFFSYHFFQRIGPLAYTAWLTLLLFLLFNTFFPAYVALVPVLGLESLRAAWLESTGLRGRLRALLPKAAPLLLSALLLAPVASYFEMVAVAQAVSKSVSWGPNYPENLGAVLLFFLRYELLGPALLTKLALIALLVTRRRSARAAQGPAALPQRISSFLSLLFVVYCGVGNINPIFFERYFIVLSPVVTAVFLLDAFALLRALPGAYPHAPRRRLRAIALAGVLACLAPVLWIKRPEIAGRIYELTTPYQGPLDFVIPFLESQVAHPEHLVIATNYEAPVYMYYLRSRVLLGYTRTEKARDMKTQPDIIIPRMTWKGRPLLHSFREETAYQAVVLDVQDFPTNNIPSLAESPIFHYSHQFRTRLAEDEESRLMIFIRKGGRGPRRR